MVRSGIAIIQAEFRGSAADWADRHRTMLRSAVTEHGAVLVRGLAITDETQASVVFRNLADDLMTEREAFAERTRVADRVYTSTRWPPNQRMCLHHELSYRLEFPRLMLFACLVAAEEGGSTGVADAAATLDQLPRDLVERFERDGWTLVRNYGGDVGLSVQASFGSEDLMAVHEYCLANGIAFALRPGGGFRTTQRRSAVVHHPLTGRRCWFNEAGFLSEWTLQPEVRRYLIQAYGADSLPFTTTFGDGEPISETIVNLINATYDRCLVREPWQSGDLLLVDNIGMAHDRAAFRGARRVLAAMADPVRLSDCSPTTDLELS
jgi:alpha-ketoglutarate-dependent taurine dioxygenase